MSIALDSVPIAYHNGWTYPRQWYKYETQTSLPIQLEAQAGPSLVSLWLRPRHPDARARHCSLSIRDAPTPTCVSVAIDVMSDVERLHKERERGRRGRQTPARAADPGGRSRGPRSDPCIESRDDCGARSQGA